MLLDLVTRIESNRIESNRIESNGTSPTRLLALLLASRRTNDYATETTVRFDAVLSRLNVTPKNIEELTELREFLGGIPEQVRTLARSRSLARSLAMAVLWRTQEEDWGGGASVPHSTTERSCLSIEIEIYIYIYIYLCIYCRSMECSLARSLARSLEM